MKGKYKILVAVVVIALAVVALAQGFKNADLFLMGHRGDTSIGRLAAGSVSIGQGGDQDYSGQLTLSQNTVKGANGGQWIQGQASEVLAAPTSGTTTDSVANLLPANAIIEGVVARVTTAITGGTCSSWSVGDSSTAARFIAADSTLTAAEVQASTGTAWTTGIASATTGIKQTSAAKVRLTCGTGNATAGAVRITVFYSQFVAPTS